MPHRSIAVCLVLLGGGAVLFGASWWGFVAFAVGLVVLLNGDDNGSNVKPPDATSNQ